MSLHPNNAKASTRLNFTLGSNSRRQRHESMRENVNKAGWSGLEQLEGRVLMSADGNDTIARAARVATVVGDTTIIGGTIEQRDVDMISFNVRAGQTLAFDVDRANGSSLDSYIRLFDANGRQLAVSDDAAAPGESFSFESYLQYRFSRAGRYYLGVSAYGNSSYNARTAAGTSDTGTTGEYTVGITTTESMLARAVRLPVRYTGASARGTVTQRGVAMYAVDVTAGLTVAFDIDRPRGSNLDSYLRIFNSAGEEVASNDDNSAPDESWSLESFLQHRFTSGGRYYIGVSAYGNSNYDPTTSLDTNTTGSTGAFVLRVTAIRPDYAGDTASTARDIGTPTRTVSYGDYLTAFDTRDAYRFTVTAESRLGATLRNLAANARLQLVRDANGDGQFDAGEVILTSDRAGTLAESLSTTLQAGTYFLLASRNSGETSYTLSVSLTPTPTPAGWFMSHISDAALRSISSQLGGDGNLTRQDMISMLRSLGNDGIVTATELSDIRLIIANAATVGMPDYVRVLSYNVVNANSANRYFLGSAMGNLFVGSRSTQLENLIGKWFFGSDRPNAGGFSYQYASGQLFVNGAAYTDIHQGQVGDCYFLAAIGSVAQRNASAIQNMFIDNGDGTYTVRFYNNGVANYVTVDRYLPTTSWGTFAFQGSDHYYYDSSNELWAALAERAYAQLNEQGTIRQDGTNSYQGISGGWMGDAYAHILGRTAAYANASSSAAVINAVLAGRMVTAGSITSPGSGIIGSHAYIVTGYNASTGLFTLYNPWGTNQPGLLSWSQLAVNFSGFSMIS